MAAALEEAGKGPSRSAQLAAEAAVTAAATALAQAKASTPVDTAAVQVGEDQLEIAEAQRDEALDATRTPRANRQRSMRLRRHWTRPETRWRRPKPRWRRRCRMGRWCI